MVGLKGTIPKRALEEVQKVIDFGAGKHGDDGWKDRDYLQDWKAAEYVLSKWRSR